MQFGKNWEKDARPGTFIPRGIPLLLCLGAWLLALGGAAEAAEPAITTVEYHGLRPTDPGGRDGLRNPERGFRTEAYIAQVPGAWVFTPFELPHHLRGRLPPGYAPSVWTLDLDRFESDGVTVAQLYCYLTEFADRPVAAEKIERLERDFALLRAHGAKALLRFAYETANDHPTNGPTRAWVLRHMDQLQPVLARNADVLYVLQAGFIGAWGEWHSATHLRSDEDRAAILGKVLEILPPGRCTQVRLPSYKRVAVPAITGAAYRPLDEASAGSPRPEARIGFHNDGVLAGPSHGGTWGQGPLFGAPGNPEFDFMTRESAWVPVDGELFWADLGWDGKERPTAGVGGAEAARYLRLQHFTTLSLAHSYSEREGANFSIDRWRSAPVAAEELAKEKLPGSDGWFEDAFGRPVARTWFEYIRDHLGYRLELRRAVFPARLARGAALDVQLSLVNRGFAAPVNPREVRLLLIAEDETVFELPLEADPRRWQPAAPGDATFAPLTHTLAFHGPLPTLPPGGYSLALWLPDPAPTLRMNPAYAIRLANRDTPWWRSLDGRRGANLIGILHVE